ncbi:MAG TPA: D-aminoacyl-tRNA deacylase [Actinomycetota bacterium]|nr:D-aminoacyl-tRNA deacylase [Actinomycetota bacterium]
MRAVVQRVRRACVRVAGQEISRIEEGLLVLLGVSTEDTGSDAASIAVKMAAKITRLRVFPDDAGVMNRSVVEHGGAVLAVSQFTLYGDVRKGNRPSYVKAAPGEAARPVYEAFCDAMRAEGLTVRQGSFGADMDVELVNWGPVTIVLESGA